MLLSERMKTYEKVSSNYLVRRTPAIIRIDGKAHRTFTRGPKKPFDELYQTTMQKTMLALCEQIQGCVLGYQQSDEISLLLKDYENLESCAWFDDRVQKIASVSASIATLAFNKVFAEQVALVDQLLVGTEAAKAADEQLKYCQTLKKAVEKGSLFDSRVFNLPKEEVCNYFIWCQQDATRNSIQMVGQANFSHKQLQNRLASYEIGHHEMYNGWISYDIYESAKNCVDEKYTVLGYSEDIIAKGDTYGDIGICVEDQEGNKFWCHADKFYMLRTLKIFEAKK